MIRIVLADDHSVVRMGFRMIIEQQMDLQVVGEASDPEEAFGLVVSEKPDVLLTDISMGTEKSGLLLAERVRDGGVATRVVMLSMHDEQEYLSQALKAGALGYVLKSSSDAELIKAIRRAADDESYVCDDMMDGACLSGGARVLQCRDRRSALHLRQDGGGPKVQGHGQDWRTLQTRVVRLRGQARSGQAVAVCGKRGFPSPLRRDYPLTCAPGLSSHCS